MTAVRPYDADDRPRDPEFVVFLDEAGNPLNVGGVLSPMNFGAVGDGVTDDSQAWRDTVAAATITGMTVDGLGRSYGVSELSFPAFDGLTIQNAALVELIPNVAARKTISFTGTGVEKVTLRNVSVNRAGDGTAGTINGSGAIWLQNLKSILIEDPEVYGNGKGTGIVVWFSKNVRIIRPNIHDMRFNDVSVTDDIIQGIWLYFCEDVWIDQPNTNNFGKTDQTSSTRDHFNRGISIGGCNRVTINNPIGYRLSQWIDLTGSGANQNVVINGGVGKGFVANGVKFSNSSVGCSAIGTIVEQVGLNGFLISAPSEAQENPGRDIQFIGCKARNTGSQSFPAITPVGFLCSPNIGYTNFPKSIQIVGCSATSDEGTSTFTVATVSTLQLNLATPISLSDGVRVRLTTTGTLPDGLALATDYWLTLCNPTGVISLASSFINAQDSVAISGISGGAGTHTLTLQTGMAYGLNVEGTGGRDNGAPIEVSNFRSAGYGVAATNNLPVAMAQVRRTGTLPVTTSSWADVSPNFSVYDLLTLTQQATVGPNFTANSSGMWTITVFLNWASNATGTRKVKIQMDTGGGYADIDEIIDGRAACPGAEPTNQTITWTGFLARGSKVKAQAWQNSGVALNVTTARIHFYRTNDIAGGV